MGHGYKQVGSGNGTEVLEHQVGGADRRVLGRAHKGMQDACKEVRNSSPVGDLQEFLA